MNIVHKRSFYPAVNQYQQGLGFKLFGINFGGGGSWLKKGLNTLVGAVGGMLKTALPFASNLITQGENFVYGKIAEIDDSFIFKSGASGDLTPAEEAKLNAWLPQFEAYCKSLSNEVIAASKMPAASQITALNTVLNKIDIVQRHYEVSPDGLSAAARQQRNVLISQSLNLVFIAITACVDKLKSQGQNIDMVTVTAMASSFSFSPLFSSTIVTTAQVKNYKLGGTLPATGIPADTIPVTIDPATGGTTSPATKKGSATMLIVAGIGVAAVAVAVLSGGGSTAGKPKQAAKRTAKRKSK